MWPSERRCMGESAIEEAISNAEVALCRAESMAERSGSSSENIQVPTSNSISNRSGSARALQRLKSTRKAAAAPPSPSSRARKPSEQPSPVAPGKATQMNGKTEPSVPVAEYQAVPDINDAREEDSGPSPDELGQCAQCGRSFTLDSLRKHERVCQKVFGSKPRKAYNPTNRRVPAEALQAAKAEQKARERERRKRGTVASVSQKDERTAASSSSKPRWKLRSEQFRAQLQAMRQVNAVEKRENQQQQQQTKNASYSGGIQKKPSSSGKQRVQSQTKQKQFQDNEETATVAPSPLDMEPPDRQQCPSCGRTFSEQAFERHVRHCENTRAKPNRLFKGSGTGSHRRASTHTRMQDRSASDFRRQ